MKRNGFTLWEIIVVLALIALGAAILYPIFARSREHRRPSCQNSLKQLSIALAQYTQDWDERVSFIALTPVSDVANDAIPVDKKHFYGWADALFPYSRSLFIYQCSSEPQTADSQKPPLATERGYADYWMNSNLSGIELAKAKAPEKTIALGDGNDGGDLTDARYNLPALPAAWISDKKSPAYRHLDGANYAFLDGHVKYLKPEQISNGPVAQNSFTFSPK